MELDNRHVPTPVAAPCTCGLRPLEHWDRGFEYRLRHGCMSAFFCVVLSHVSRDLETGRSLPKCVNGFIVPEVHSEPEQATGPNLSHVHQTCVAHAC
jgi:hypothetical protein